MIQNSTKVYKASSNHIYSEIGAEAVILDLTLGIYYGLNETGAQIWQWIQEPKTLSELSQLLLDEYDVNREEALEDINNLLQQMIDTGLIEIID
jgi:Coenzyme PQQ synthesis protein D (PqqD)